MGNPLKKLGFQMYKGATPHLRNIHVNNTNHETPIIASSLIEDVFTKYKNTCSSKNQSNVTTLV